MEEDDNLAQNETETKTKNKPAYPTTHVSEGYFVVLFVYFAAVVVFCCLFVVECEVEVEMCITSEHSNIVFQF